MSQTPEFEQWLSSVRNVGTQMANTLYNISHRGTVVISGDDAEAMIKMVAAWDTIPQSPPTTDHVVGSEPLFWYRPVGEDGGYEGPHHAYSKLGKMYRHAMPGQWKPLFTAPVEQMVAPPGYALVPIAPSKLMIDAGHRTYSQETLATEWIARAVWTAMVSTAKLEDQP